MGFNLFDLPTNILKSELERRERIASETPQPLAAPDFAVLHLLIVDYINRVISTGHRENDAPHLIYEAAIEAVYGHTIWYWLNKQD